MKGIMIKDYNGLIREHKKAHEAIDKCNRASLEDRINFFESKTAARRRIEKKYPLFLNLGEGRVYSNILFKGSNVMDGRKYDKWAKIQKNDDGTFTVNDNFMIYPKAIETVTYTYITKRDVEAHYSGVEMEKGKDVLATCMACGVHLGFVCEASISNLCAICNNQVKQS